MTTIAGSQLSPRTVAAYSADWELFGDWCSAVEAVPLPAGPATVLAFLDGCPATVAGQRRRVTAIDHHHRLAGLTPPGADPGVQFALGRPAPPEPADLTASLELRLRHLPSHGWTVGLFGRRDRVLLILAAAGITPVELATTPAAALTVHAGTTTLTRVPVDGVSVALTLAAAADPQVCGPCACARWLKLLNLIADSVSHRRWRDALHAAAPVTPGSPHLCLARTAPSTAAGVLPLLPRIDQWGYLDLTPQPVGPRSLHRLTTRLLSDQPAPVRRSLPPTPSEPGTPPPPGDDLSPTPISAPFGPAELAAGLERRRWQKDRTAEIAQLLDDLETRIAAALSSSAAPPGA